MTFTVNSLTRCAGLNHWTVTITIGGQSFTVATNAAEMLFDPTASVSETRQQILERLRSAYKEAGGGTFAAAQTAIVGKTFQL